MDSINGYLMLIGLLQLVQLSFTRFVFQFQLHAVTTDGICTGTFESTPECETYLNRFCLREFGSSRTSNFDDSDCPLGSSDQRFGPDADDTLPITRDIFSDLFWPGAFQMFIGAYDDDSFFNFDDHLDYIFIEMQLNVTESNDFSAIAEFTGVMNKVSVNMSFRVRMCQENFYGANCDVMCIAQNDEVNGYYTCNGDGSIQCRPGFQNESNNCRDDDPCASTPCANNGNCTAIGPLNYTCECTPGYTGPNCSKEIDGCLTTLCPNNSTCVNGSKCICHPGFQLNGEMCVELPTDTSNQPPGATDGQIGVPVIIGAAAGGAVLFVLVVFILVVVMAVLVASHKKSQSRHGKIPENGSLIHQLPDHKDTLKLEMTKKMSVKREDSMEDNPVYNQVSPTHSPQPPQQDSSMSDSSSPNTHDTHADSGELTISVAPNPVYGVNQTSSGSPRPHRSTIRHIQNPVYGDPSDKNIDRNVYSTPQLSTQSNSDNSGQPEYSYAIVDAVTSNISTQQVGGTLQSVVEHKYAMIDQSVKIPGDVPIHSHTALPYDQLRQHEECSSDKGKSQTTTIRLAEDEDLGYSVLT